MVKNQVQLITYPDSLGGDLKSLDRVLEDFFPGLFSAGVHILPPFPSSGDRGFAPLTYLKIDPKFGTWDDIKKISKDHAVILDLMVNHISEKSPYFQDFLKHGRHSKYADLFIPINEIWPNGQPSKDDLDKIFLRRDVPYSEFNVGENHEPVKIWTTFGKSSPSEQIDINVNSIISDDLITEILSKYRDNNVKIVRLDAVGYVIKKRGTSCFFVEPEIFSYLKKIQNLAASLGLEILPEIHAEFEIQVKLADEGYWLYDFILPYLILETLITKSAEKIKNYLQIRPRHQFTMLDCHDGVPLKPDLNGLYDSETAHHVVEVCVERGANISPILSSSHKDADEFDVHQINGTYYSLLDCDDSAYLIARALQFFTPGIPQVYYVGLLAGKNDNDAVTRTGEGREINRHNFSIDEINHAIKQPVVEKLLDLIVFRNTYPVFDGEFTLEESDSGTISMLWQDGDRFARLLVDLLNTKGEITFFDLETKTIKKIEL